MGLLNIQQYNLEKIISALKSSDNLSRLFTSTYLNLITNKFCT